MNACTKTNNWLMKQENKGWLKGNIPWHKKIRCAIIKKVYERRILDNSKGETKHAYQNTK